VLVQAKLIRSKLRYFLVVVEGLDIGWEVAEICEHCQCHYCSITSEDHRWHQSSHPFCCASAKKMTIVSTFCSRVSV
jgi:hypothetical protein